MGPQPTSDTSLPINDDAAREAAALGETDSDQAEAAVPAEAAAPASQTPAPAQTGKNSKKARQRAAKAQAAAPAAPPAAPAPAPVAQAAAVPAADPEPEGDVPAEVLPEVRLELCLPGLVAIPEKGYCARHIEVRLKPETARFLRVLAASLETEVKRVTPGKAVEWLLDQLTSAAKPAA